MKRRLSLALAIPITAAAMMVSGAFHPTSPHTFAAAGTPPPPPSLVPTTIPGPPGPPSPTPTATPIPPTATNTVAPTETPPAPTETAPAPAATKTQPAPLPTATNIPHMTATTKPGGGGTYVYSSGSGASLGRLPAGTSKSPASAGGTAPSVLPRTGGGSGQPVSPLAPLALLAALAIVVGRVLPRLVKR